MLYDDIRCLLMPSWGRNGVGSRRGEDSGDVSWCARTTENGVLHGGRIARARDGQGPGERERCDSIARGGLNVKARAAIKQLID